MFKCEYCGKELKSKGGKTRHEGSCKAKDVDFEQLEKDIEIVHPEPKMPEDVPTPEGLPHRESNEPLEEIDGKVTMTFPDGDGTRVVKLDVLGAGGHYSNGKDNNYYEGHPRRLIKLRGLLSRTRDEDERSRLMKMIIEMRNEAK